MMGQGRWFRRLGLLAPICTLAAAGCLSLLHPVQAPPPEKVQVLGLPQECRHHLYIFIVHGIDPLDYANLSGVRDYLNGLGYIKTYQGQIYHVWHFTKEIRRIHEEDPRARFALVGFGFGAHVAREMADAVQADNVFIDLLVYISGNTLKCSPGERPDNVAKLIHILPRAEADMGDPIDVADDLEFTDTHASGAPTHAKTLEILARELGAAATRVPLVLNAPPPPLPEESPTPRPVKTIPADGPRDEWDLLKADSISRSRTGHSIMLYALPEPVESSNKHIAPVLRSEAAHP